MSESKSRDAFAQLLDVLREASERCVGPEWGVTDLDDVIARIAEHRPFDQLQLQRLKKRKLLLKDQISKIESELLPDIIA